MKNMKRHSSIILLIAAILLTTSIHSQNKGSDTTFIGEINPSLKLNTYNGNDILDFDNGLIVTIGKERNETTRIEEYFISLIDLSYKQFGKISTKNKIKIPNTYLQDYRDDNMFKIYRFGNTNIKVFQFKRSGQQPFYVIIDYASKELYSVELPSSVLYRSFSQVAYLEQSEQFFFTNKREFVVEFQKRTDNSLKLYQIINNKGEKIDEVKINKKFISPSCNYYRGLSGQNTYYEINPDCAYNNTVHAFARKPTLYGERGTKLSSDVAENESTVFIHFYEGNYKDHIRDKSFIYTYNFHFDKGKVSSALISLDFKHIIVNNQYIYSLPKVEITK
jgi:hypothetical protein